MIVSFTILMALFVAGAIYTAMKLREDWKARRRGMTALGIAAFACHVMALSFGAHGVLVSLGL